MNARTPLAGALDCGRRGWRVLPVHAARGGRCTCRRATCPSGGKHPREAGWTSSATTDPERIRAWEAEYAGGNYGIATGATSGLVVLDVDVAKGGLDTLEALEGEHGRGPDAPVVLTPSGGMHIYFRHPGCPVKTCAEALGPGLDVRGDVNGMVVAPGSVHRNGGTYAWNEEMHPDRVPLPPLPSWVLPMLDSAQTSTTTVLPAVRMVPAGDFDLEAWIGRHGLDVRGPFPWGSDRGWKFRRCPAADQHSDASDGRGAFIVQRPDGRIGAACFHASCSWGWKELRAAVEPEYATKRAYFDRLAALRRARGAA